MSRIWNARVPRLANNLTGCGQVLGAFSLAQGYVVYDPQSFDWTEDLRPSARKSIEQAVRWSAVFKNPYAFGFSEDFHLTKRPFYEQQELNRNVSEFLEASSEYNFQVHLSAHLLRQEAESKAGEHQMIAAIELRREAARRELHYQQGLSLLGANTYMDPSSGFKVAVEDRFYMGQVVTTRVDRLWEDEVCRETPITRVAVRILNVFSNYDYSVFNGKIYNNMAPPVPLREVVRPNIEWVIGDKSSKVVRIVETVPLPR